MTPWLWRILGAAIILGPFFVLILAVSGWQLALAIFAGVGGLGLMVTGAVACWLKADDVERSRR